MNGVRSSSDWMWIVRFWRESTSIFPSWDHADVSFWDETSAVAFFRREERVKVRCSVKTIDFPFSSLRFWSRRERVRRRVKRTTTGGGRGGSRGSGRRGGSQAMGDTDAVRCEVYMRDEPIQDSWYVCEQVLSRSWGGGRGWEDCQNENIDRGCQWIEPIVFSPVRESLSCSSNQH